MLIVSVNEGAHTVVPQLDHPIVKAGQDPWPGRVEGQTYKHTIYSIITLARGEML